MVANQASVGRKEAANLHRARHVRTRLTGMSFGSSYFTLLRTTMIGLSAQAPLADENCNCTPRCESEVRRFSEFLATALRTERERGALREAKEGVCNIYIADIVNYNNFITFNLIAQSTTLDFISDIFSIFPE